MQLYEIRSTAIGAINNRFLTGLLHSQQIAFGHHLKLTSVGTFTTAEGSYEAFLNNEYIIKRESIVNFVVHKFFEVHTELELWQLNCSTLNYGYPLPNRSGWD